MYEDFEDNNPKWMKLVDLYNERWKGKWGDDEGYFTYEMRFDAVHLISKPMGFIKWLVDNDKIDKEQFFWFLYGPHFISDLSDAIIAWLAISDTPIEYLIDLLK